MSATIHGHTSHGHPCCGQAAVGDRPSSIARCGGPGLCSDCAGRRDQIHQTTAVDPAVPPRSSASRAREITIPCIRHRDGHPVTLAEAAAALVVADALAAEAQSTPDIPALGRNDLACVRELIDLARDGEGYLEHVESRLGDDVIGELNGMVMARNGALTTADLQGETVPPNVIAAVVERETADGIAAIIDSLARQWPDDTETARAVRAAAGNAREYPGRQA